MAWPFDHDRVGQQVRTKDPADPSTTTAAWDAMAPRWAVVDALLGGTETMRQAGSTYLPQHDAESPKSYNTRLKRATLTNFFEITLNSLCGKPFAEKIKIGEDVIPEVKALFEDVDLLGNELDTFAARWFRESLSKGFSHVLVDFPRTAPAQGQVRTLEQDRKERVRPYLVHITPENMIAASAQIVDGREILTHVRIREVEVVMDGFAEKSIQRIRELTPGHVRVWRLRDKRNAGQKDKWEIEDEYDVSIQEIPLVTFYTTRDGLMVCKPPLQDLAWLNVAHWQSASDQRNVLTVSRFPMLACSGVSDEESIVKVGPNQILMTSDANGKFYYVEHTGAAIEAGRNDLQDLEAAMTAYGAEFLKAQPDRFTATARSLDSAEALSPLQQMVRSFQGAISTVIGYMGMWLGRPMEEAGHVELDDSFSLDTTSQWEIQALQGMRASRDISRVALLTEMKRRRVLSQDYDIEADVQTIEDETAAGFGPPTGGDLDPTLPQNQPQPEPGAEKGSPPNSQAPSGQPSDKNPTAGGRPRKGTPAKPKGQTAAQKARAGRAP